MDITPITYGQMVTVPARARMRIADDVQHSWRHALEGDNDGCDVCQAVHARIEQWKRDNPWFDEDDE